MPPSLPNQSVPSNANTSALESAWGDVPCAAVQTTFTQTGAAEASPRNAFALNAEQPLALGKVGRSWRSPAIKTTFGLLGCAAMAPCTLPCPPGKMSGDGRPMENQE